MKEKIYYYLPSIIFNSIEILVSFLIGSLLKLKFEEMFVLVLIFCSIRFTSGSAIHYKDFRKCFIWTLLFYSSLFLAGTVGFIYGIISSIFSGIILTNKGNMQEFFNNLTEWGGNSLNTEVFNWVKFNQENEKLIEYEAKLKETDKQKYYIFIYRFREFKSYSQIAKIMDMDAQRISDEIKIMSHFIEYSIRLD